MEANQLPHLRGEEFAGAARTSKAPIVVLDEILAELEAMAHLAPESFDTMAGNIRRFGRFCQIGHGIDDVGDIGPAVAEAFVYAALKDGGQPSLNTMHGRRAATSLLYARGRSMDLLTGNPVQDLRLPPRTGRKARPLEDDEIALAREWALDQRERGHRAPIWALAEAGAHQGEIAQVHIEDLDLVKGTVYFRGGRRTLPRVAPLTAWGADRLSRYVARRGSTSGLLLPLTHPDHKSRASVVGMALHGILEDAGLLAEDVCARSIVAWAGVQAFLEEERIEQVAIRLGMRRLDAAASLIGWDWRAGDR